jgi:hypothetical protein
MPLTTSKIVFIDADPIRYRVGFAAETISYEVIFEDESGTMHMFFFEPELNKSAHDRLKAFLSTHPDWSVLEKIKHVEIEEWPYTKQMLDVQLESIKKEIREHYRLDRRDVEFILILSGKGNFRDKIATLKPYKGNRDPEHKPQHFAALTKQLIEYGAEVINGKEADDEISIRCWDMIRTTGWDGHVVATIDKDLDQIPGEHYDYMKKVFYTVDPLDAEAWFWTQVLSGDPTDNIGGACGIGPKKAQAIVADMDLMDPPGCWQDVLAAYDKVSDDEKCYHFLAPSYDVALETARLVYLQRREDEIWEPPT